MRRRQRHLLFCLSPDSGRKPRGPPCLLPAANMGPNPFAKSTSHHLGFNISAPRMPVSIANTITGAELMFSGNRLKPETDTCLNILRGLWCTREVKSPPRRPVITKDSANSRSARQVDCTTNSTTLGGLPVTRGQTTPPQRNNRAGPIYICRGSHTDEVLCVKCYITDIIDITPSGWLARMRRSV
jgi:hypothetical protein